MEVVGGQAPQPDDASRRAADSQETQPRPFGALLSQVPADIRDVSFGMAVRGYDRHEVDAYVERVNRIIAELEVSRSPQSAVKNALDRVGEQTSGVLQRAREVAEELTATAMAEADHLTRRAQVEAEEMVENAQMQAHQLRGQSKEEADAIVAGASAKAAERLERGQEELRRLQEQAEKRLSALREDIEAATRARSQLLEELRRTAAGLDEFATGMAAAPRPEGPAGQPSDSPTERMPKRQAARPRQQAAPGGTERTTEQRASSTPAA
jgi:DivIVA domain-containing protein